MELAIAGIGVVVLFVVGILVMITRFYRKVDQGRALLINKMKSEPEVTFTGGVVLPIIHRAEVMDISVKTIEIDRRGHDGLICNDNIRADIRVTFFVRVNKTTDDVLKVAQSLGCERASDQTTLEELFVAKFSEALKTVGKRMEFEQLYSQRDDFKDQIIEVIGTDLNGYVLDDAAIDYLEQTPVQSLDPQNILDARGIRKITEITSGQNVLTNDLRQTERKEITRQNLEADEAILELERRRADAEAKQKREIATMVAREAAETKTVQAEEHNRAEKARIKAEEDISISDLNRRRQVEVADKDRERVVGIKAEQVERDRALEEINRERDTELMRIDKEKALEKEKREIAEVIRGRVAVEKSVAEEEERIADLRLLAEATRYKDKQIIEAEGNAEEALVKELKAAEAAERAAEHQARKRVTLANAELQASDIEAKAKIRLSEGVQAEEAASGLAVARVKEATASAHEKEGLVEARVSREKLLAQAEGQERVGLAQAKVDREQLTAQAEGARAKADAEAGGIEAKAEAMKKLEGQGWRHEEFRLKLDALKEIELQALQIKRQIAEQQAQVMGAAFDSADIKIVGGDGEFFDKFVQAVSLGESIDATVGTSGTIQQVFGGYLEGDADLPADLKEVLVSKGVDTEALRNLSVAGLLSKLASGGLEPEVKAQLTALLGAGK